VLSFTLTKNKWKCIKKSNELTLLIIVIMEEEEIDEYGSYCCGERMVLSSSGICYECLICGSWEYSSS